MITEEEKEFRTRRWLISGFQEYKDTRALPVLAVPLYDALYTLGMLTPTMPPIPMKSELQC